MGLEIRVLGFVGDQNALEQAGEIAVVEDRVVHRGPVVPERDRARAPAEADLKVPSWTTCSVTAVIATPNVY